MIYRIVRNPALEPAWGTGFKSIAETWEIERHCGHLGWYGGPSYATKAEAERALERLTK
jgi:hypothetical protein